MCRLLSLWSAGVVSQIRFSAVSWMSDERIVSALALVTYDYFLTVDQERKYVWNTKWTPGTVLFLVIRYLPFIDLPLIIYDQSNLGASQAVCTAILWWYQFSCIVAIALTDSVIALRTWAIWGRSLTCGVLLILLFLGATASSVYYQVVALKEEQYFPTPPGFDLPGCIFFSVDATSLTNMYTIYAVYESLIFAATLVRGVGHLRHSPAKLMSILYRDAFLSSSCLFVIAILNIVMLKVSPPWSYGLTSLYRAMNAILPERIIINLRETTMGININGWDVMTDTSVGSHNPSRRSGQSARDGVRRDGRRRGEPDSLRVSTELSVVNAA
ncbi:hypothetical protein CALCODRAFT_286513 [Calocera cornea HHB12733]|uniref:DUF6533 domain-containing protein n=1 Tax=Calocera cornea HHB12733 TaxID=1353952 RepID=A0A165FX59_9BASI|nr:hypothetical protein CALCODRAFT_286513 [Calocera cornea HHB12733]